MTMPVIGIALASATIPNDVTHSSSSEVPSSTPRVNDDRSEKTELK